MTKKKSVTMQEDKLPKAVRAALGVQDEVLKKEVSNKADAAKAQKEIGRVLDANGLYMFPIVDAAATSKFDTFWDKWSSLFVAANASNATKEKARGTVEEDWNRNKAAAIELGDHHKKLLDAKSVSMQWNTRKQGIARQMAWGDPDDGNKGKEAKTRAKDKTGNVSSVTLSKVWRNNNEKKKGSSNMSAAGANQSIDTLVRALNNTQTNYNTLLEKYVEKESCGTKKQRQDVTDAITNVIAKLEVIREKL